MDVKIKELVEQDKKEFLSKTGPLGRERRYVEPERCRKYFEGQMVEVGNWSGMVAYRYLTINGFWKNHHVRLYLKDDRNPRFISVKL